MGAWLRMAQVALVRQPATTFSVRGLERLTVATFEREEVAGCSPAKIHVLVTSSWTRWWRDHWALLGQSQKLMCRSGLSVKDCLRAWMTASKWAWPECTAGSTTLLAALREPVMSMMHLMSKEVALVTPSLIANNSVFRESCSSTCRYLGWRHLLS